MQILKAKYRNICSEMRIQPCIFHSPNKTLPWLICY